MRHILYGYCVNLQNTFQHFIIILQSNGHLHPCFIVDKPYSNYISDYTENNKIYENINNN